MYEHHMFGLAWHGDQQIVGQTCSDNIPVLLKDDSRVLWAGQGASKASRLPHWGVHFST